MAGEGSGAAAPPYDSGTGRRGRRPATIGTATAQPDVSQTTMSSLSALARLEWLMPPRYARWCRRGFVAGAVGGAAAQLLLFWSFWGGSAPWNIDGEGQAILSVALGFPFSLIAISVPDAVSWLVGPLLILSAASTWALVFATAATIGALIVYRIRDWLLASAG